MTRARLSAAAILIVGWICLASSFGHSETLVIGSIADEPAEEIRLFLPIARYLETHLSTLGIKEVAVRVVRSIPEMADHIRRGQVDLYIDSPYPSMAVNASAPSRMLLRRWKDGISHYHSVIFTRKDQGIRSLSDLKGKMVAFEDPFSSSSFFFPKTRMLAEGLKLVEKSSPFEALTPDEVGYLFTHDDENSMVWLLKGKVDAAAMNYASFQEYSRDRIDVLAILGRTHDIPRHIVNVRGGLSAATVAKIKQILTTMNESAEGQAVLAAFESTTRFDEIPDPTLADLSRSQSLIDQEIGNLNP